MTLKEFLESSPGRWFSDADLLRSGGSNALSDIRDLRKGGMNLVARPHPSMPGLQWQYVKPVEEAPVDDIEPTPVFFNKETKRWELVTPRVCEGCGGEYRIRNEHLHSKAHKRGRADKIREAQTTIEMPFGDEATEPIDGGSFRLEFGKNIVCPRCNGVRRPERLNAEGETLPPDSKSMDPDNKEVPCRKCKGLGLVQVGS